MAPHSSTAITMEKLPSSCTRLIAIDIISHVSPFIFATLSVILYASAPNLQ